MMINILLRGELWRPYLHRRSQSWRHHARDIHQGTIKFSRQLCFYKRDSVQDHAEKAAGIILIGSYLPDLFGDQSNAFPVPVLTVVGELDGMTISYVYRSVQPQGKYCG